MEDKNVNKKHAYLSIISLFLTFILLALSILLFVFNSLGWFANNSTVSSSGMNISIDAGDFMLINLQSFPVTEITENNGVTTYQFDNFLENESQQIPLYDPASLIGSKYKLALVLKFNCSIKAGKSVNLSAEYLEDWYGNTPTVTIEDGANIPDGAYLNSTTNVYHNFLSNCVQIRPVTLIENENNQNIVTTINNDEPKTFFSNLNTQTKNDASNNTILIGNYSATENDKDFDIYLVLEYNQELISYFCHSTSYYRCEYENDIVFKFTDAI